MHEPADQGRTFFTVLRVLYDAFREDSFSRQTAGQIAQVESLAEATVRAVLAQMEARQWVRLAGSGQYYRITAVGVETMEQALEAGETTLA